MPLTITTVENVTTITGTGGPTTVFTPSPAEIGRYKLRVVRYIVVGNATLGDGVLIQGITPTATGTETQTLWQSTVTAATPFVDQTSFPDEAEFRGKIQVTITAASGTPLLILYHG